MTAAITTVRQAKVGRELPAVSFPVTLYRLVMAAGGSRDFNAIHHNRDYARGTGAPDVYANTLILMGCGNAPSATDSKARIVAIRSFRMSRFTTVGTAAVVTGTVKAVDIERGIVTFTISTADTDGDTVGPRRSRCRLVRSEAAMEHVAVDRYPGHLRELSAGRGGRIAESAD